MTAKRVINPPLNLYKKIALSFIFFTFLLIVVIFYFTFSYAYLDIYPKKQEISSDFNVIIVDNAGAEKQDEGIFVGKLVAQDLEAEKIFSSSGSKQLAGDITGQVKIINNLSKAQALIATTRLLTPDGILFRIKNRVDIPAGGSIIADVYADDPTKPLAIAGTKFTIPGLSNSLQQFVYAQAADDFAAGGQEVKVVTQEDLDNAVSSLADELSKQVIKEEDTNKAKILNKEIVDKVFSNKVDDQVNEFTLKLKIKVVGVMFDESIIKQFAVSVLEGLVPADKQLISTNKDNLIYEIEKYDAANKLAQIKSNIKGETILSDNSPILERDKLIKLKFVEIKAYLENFEEIENVEIKFFPSWVRKLPYFADHIIIRIAK